MPQVRLDEIELDHSPQVRASLQNDVVEDYAEVYSAKKPMPPIDVFKMEKSQFFFVADGRHRIAAAKKASLKELNATIHTGNTDACIAFAIRANRLHGIRRTLEDKRACVETAITQWPDKSDRMVAEMCLVGDHLVASVREAMGSVSNNESGARTRTCPVSGQSVSNNGAIIGKDKKKYPRKKRSVQVSRNKSAGNVSSPNSLTDNKTKVKDAIGYTVPEEIVEVWNRRQEILDMANELSRISHVMKQAQNNNDPLFRWADFDALDKPLERAHNALMEVLPHTVCTECGGHLSLKVDRACRFCRGAGLISEKQWDVMVPEEIRKMRLGSSMMRQKKGAENVIFTTPVKGHANPSISE